MATISYTVNFIERQYNIKVQILKIDGESALLGDVFDDWKRDIGIKINISAPHNHDQHGRAERSGGILTNRATKLRLSANLPDSIWPEIYEAAGYILNRSPIRRLGWKSPTTKLHEWLGRTDPMPKCYHLRPYGCRAYAYIHNRPKLDKLAAKAHVGYLVGYVSTNIWRIWIPTLKRVIPIRDVTFDTTKRYDPKDDSLDLTEEEAIVLEVPQIQIDVDLDYDLSVTIPQGVGPENERSIDKPGDTVVVDQGTDQNTQLRTPEATPEPSSEPEVDQIVESVQTDLEATQAARLEPSSLTLYDQPSSQEQTLIEQRTPILPSNTNANTNTRTNKGKKEYIDLKGKARKEIKGDVNEGNIVEGKRKRERKRAVFTTLLESIEQKSFFYTAFATALNDRSNRPHRTNLPSPPGNWSQMLRHPHCAGFQAAARKEYSTLEGQNTWDCIRTDSIDDSTTTVLPVMWVFTYKFDEDGYLIKYKARLVVRGDLHQSQQEETYAATLATRVFRTLMSVAAHFDLDIYQLDAINAFTNATLDETVYIKCPDGFTATGYCLELKRALYGLPRSPLLWFNDLSATMRRLGLEPVPECACLFTNDKLIVFFFVDDICVCHPRNLDSYNTFRSQLMNEYEMRDMGELKWFLGIRVVRDRSRRKLWLCQDSYIQKIVARFGLENSSAKTPMTTEPLTKYTGKATAYQIRTYQEIVGSCSHAATISRPDTAYTTQKLSEHLLNPSLQHQTAAERCLAYLNSTKTLALEYGSAPESKPYFEGATDSDCTNTPSNYDFVGFSDASYADNVDTRRSTQGCKYTLFGGTNDWKVVKQSSVATSTTEAELLAVSTLSSWLLWYQRFFDNIKLNLDQELVAYCDNLQTVRLLMKESPKLVTKLKHVDIHQHWLREQTANQKIRIEWVSTSEQAADGLTKALSVQKHSTFLKQLNMVDIRDEIAKLVG